MILKVANLRKEFGNIVAMDNLDFALDDGEVHAIIGPNGAGKTTFFNLLTGTLPVDSGSVEFRGEPITNKTISEIAQMGMVRKFQTPSVYEELTIEEHFEIAVNPKKFADPDEQKRWAIEQVNLEDRLAEKAKSLDHGNKQWLEIGMILATDPGLLLLDEPTAGMTIEETRRTAELIKRLNKSEGMSIITIEHDLDFVRNLEATVTVLHHGSRLAEGSIEEIEENVDVQRVYIGED